ncbi:MAG TPA: hypothetical protein DD395_01710 [Lachnospiraceae bacterium]|nr:hypothetical protein [Lachnospiraceae bacterium]
MDDLRKIVKELEEEKNEDKQIALLQHIESTLLNEYNIVIKDTIIEPLRVEAYYYPFNDECKFNDPCAHKCTKKINNFGKLYFIEERYGYPGIDLCLSLGNYYLSFLIKNSRIGDTYYKQMDLFDRFQDKRDEIETMDVLERVKNKEQIVFKTSRVGLKKSETKFAHALLASVIELNNSSEYDFERGFGKEMMVANYIFENNIPGTDENIKALLGYRSQNVKRIIEEMQ